MRYLVTSALPYIHGIPHLGNFVGSIFPADVMARFLRFKGEDVLFICGSDMHGSPLEVAAYKQGRDVRELAYENHEKIKRLMEDWLVSVDFWGHTDSEENKETTYEIFWGLYDNGYIEEEEITMPKCNSCGRYLADRWIEGKCPYCGGLARGDQCDDCGAILTPDIIIDPYCVYCGSHDISFVKTKHLVFRLDKLTGKLKQFYEERKRLWPENARKVTEHYLYKEGLKPRSITRHLTFGFPVPLEGYEDQVFYVWFDAPIGYIGITRQFREDWEEWWKGDTFIIHYIGKDNIFFHTLFWPGMLIGSGKGYTLPKVIASSEFLISKGVKFSKSRGVGLNLETAKELLPVEYWRYVLASLFPEHRDMEFSFDILKEKVNKELVDNISNFIYRVLKLVEKKGVGSIESDEAREEVEKVKSLAKEIEEVYMSFLGFQRVTSLANRLAAEGNAWLNRREPWKEEDPGETLAVALYYVKVLAASLYPILPKTMGRLLHDMGVERWEEVYSPELKSIPRPRKLFERISEETLEEWRARFGSPEETVTLDDVLSLDLMTGRVIHVQEIGGEEERWLIILEGPDGRKYKAAPPIKKKYSPEELKDRTILFAPLEDKQIVSGIEVNATIPLAGDSVIMADREVVGRVR